MGGEEQASGARRGLVVIALLLLATVAALVLLVAKAADYVYWPVGTIAGDDTAPAMAALIHGDVHAFGQAQPALGLFSLLARLPFAAAARALGGGLLAEYRAGALACLLLAAAAGLLVAGLCRRRGVSWPLSALAGVLPLANPITLTAIQTGHPEDPLCAALCVGAVLAAERRRPGLAALGLGLAIGTKPWGLLAAPAVALALPAATWLRAAVIAGVVAALFVAPGPLISPSRFAATSRPISETSYVTAQSLWWPVAVRKVERLPYGGSDSYLLLPGRLDRRGISVALLLAACLIALVAARRGRRRGHALALLALAMLARDVADPAALWYYGVPLLIALGALATEEPEGALRLMACAIVGIWLSLHVGGEATHFALTLAWAVPVGAALARPLLRSAPAALASPVGVARAR